MSNTITPVEQTSVDGLELLSRFRSGEVPEILVLDCDPNLGTLAFNEFDPARGITLLDTSKSLSRPVRSALSIGVAGLAFSCVALDANEKTMAISLSKSDRLSECTSVETFQRPESQPAKNSEIRESIVALQKWEGRVLEVLDDTFTARLTDLTSEGIEEDAEFSVNELSPDDAPLLQPGAIFYWAIGRQTDATQSRRTISELRFRRLPSWTPEEIEQARLEASVLASELGISNT